MVAKNVQKSSKTKNHNSEVFFGTVAVMYSTGNSWKGFWRCRLSCLLHYLHYLSILMHTNSWDDVSRRPEPDLWIPLYLPVLVFELLTAIFDEMNSTLVNLYSGQLQQRLYLSSENNVQIVGKWEEQKMMLPATRTKQGRSSSIGAKM